MFLPSGRRTLSLLILLAGGAHLRAQAVASAPSPEATAGAAVTAAPANRWEMTSTLRGSIGWRDNILLSPFGAIERSFVRAEAEVFVFRPVGDLEFLSFVTADVLRYASPPPETEGDEQFFGHAEIRWKPVPILRVALKAAGFHEDTVIDLSETEQRRFVAPTRVQGGFVTAATRFKLPAGFVAEPIVQVKRTDYREFPGDYDALQAGGRIEWKRSDWLALSAAWFEQERRYAERTQYTASGRARPGTRLEFQQRDGELRATTRWKRAGEWQVSAIAGHLENRDQSSGFFDYDQERARLVTEWQGAVWRVVVEGEGRRTDYLVQTVGAGISPPVRMAEYFETRARIERRFRDVWLLFAEHRWERNRSNEYGFSYRANTALAGIQRDF